MTSKWRTEFMHKAGKAGIPLYAAERLLRYARTLQRLAEAQCNGDFPADNGEREIDKCDTCGTYWHPSVLKGKDRLCPDCRTEKQVWALLDPLNIIPKFQGDPRGCVLTVKLPSGEEIGVPS